MIERILDTILPACVDYGINPEQITDRAEAALEEGVHELSCGCVMHTTGDQFHLVRCCRVSRRLACAYIGLTWDNSEDMEWIINLWKDYDEVDVLLLIHVVNFASAELPLSLKELGDTMEENTEDDHA